MSNKTSIISHKVKLLFLIAFSGLFLVGCSVINKFKSKNKEKVESVEIKKQSVNSEVDNSYSTFSSKSKIEDLAILLSSIKWNYQGQDSAEIEVITTPGGVKIKTKGTATAEFESVSESKLNKEESAETTEFKAHTKDISQVEEESHIKVKTKDVNQQKEVFRYDFSAWFWIVLLVLGAICVIYYFKKLKEFK